MCYASFGGRRLGNIIHYLCWDIDGTLLSTARAGVYAWEDAALEVVGKEIEFEALATSGRTDIEIGKMILEEYGHSPSGGELDRIVGLYQDYLPRSLPRRQGEVLPNVRNTLEALRTNARVESILLTGNTQRGAKAKLTHYGLDDFFDFDQCAFSDGTQTRADVAFRARDLLTERMPAFDQSRVLVIGDTPHDIDCADAIGVRTLSVATGTYDTCILLQCNPWKVVDVLPEPQAFLRLIDELSGSNRSGQT